MNPNTATGTWLRVALASFGVFLSIQAAWILLAERHRLSHIQLPVDGKTATIAFAEQDKIKQAASLAVVRGDLWAESAFAYGSRIWIDRAMVPDAGDQLNTGGTKDFHPSPEIFTASRGRLAHVRGPGRPIQMVRILAGLVAQDILLHGTE